MSSKKPYQPLARLRHTSISWTSPALASLSLFLAIVAAVSHHFFYHFWNAKPVASDTQQQWIIRVGTAFGFLVNSLMVVPISYAFVQQVWLSLQRRPVKVSEIDTLFSALGNIFNLLSPRVWLTRPLLALTAIVVWTVPIGSILPPGTLTVSYSQATRPRLMSVAEFDYSNNLNYMPGYSTNAGGFPVLSNAGPELSRLYLASASSMATLQQQAPEPNSTFTLKTYAPALTCEFSPEVYKAFNQKVLSAGGNAMVQEASVLFFSWVPQSDNATDIPAINSTSFTSLDQSTNASSQIYLYANSGDIVGGLQGADQPALIACSLKNASYTLAFTFNNTQQHLTVLAREILNDVSAYKIINKLYFGQSTALQRQNVAYVSLMSAFGRIFTGGVFGEANHLTGTFYDSVSTLVLSTSLSNTSASWSNETFANRTEEVFRNATFSLLSSALFTASSSASVPQNVTIFANQNIYTYKPSSLLISYGVVIAVGAIATVIGIIVTLHNGLTFSTSFSTFLRTTRNPRLDGMVYAEDMTGAEPCGEHVRKAKLIYRSTAQDGMVPGFWPTWAAEQEEVKPRMPTARKEAPSVTMDDRGREDTVQGMELNRLRSLRSGTRSYTRLISEDHVGERVGN